MSFRDESECVERVPTTPVTVDQEYNIAVVAKNAIVDMMRGMNISVKDYEYNPDPEVEQRLREEVGSWGTSVTSSPRFESSIITGIHVGTIYYGHCPLNVQVITAVYTFMIAMIDDLVPSADALEAFSVRLCMGKPQMHPVLDRMVDILGRMADCYLPYSTQAIVTSTIQYINITAYEKRTEDMLHYDGSSDFANYKRDRSGIGEGYGFFPFDKMSCPDLQDFVQVIPDTIIFLAYINDVFSFYKEELAGERTNYVNDRASASGMTVAEALNAIVNDSIAAVERARRNVRGEKAREMYEKFVRGYLYMHYVTPRYFLEDLFGTDYP